MERIAVILQARMGSRRLPGKVLARIGTRTLLEHAIIRLQNSGLPIIVATTIRREDDTIDREARRLGVEVVRGDTDDVLARFIQACRTHGLTTAIRATADNPFVDGDGAGRVLALTQRVGADHVIEHGLPIGAAVEAVTLAALERAHTLITDPYDREHVTSFIKRDGRFRALRVVAPGDVRRPGLRLTVDTQEDLDFVRAVLAQTAAGTRVPRLGEVIRAAEVLRVRAAAAAQSLTRQGA
jgi:spore coat polysaccharide biosynthesis protein SpsF (cytidylyltransferase family)